MATRDPKASAETILARTVNSETAKIQNIFGIVL